MVAGSRQTNPVRTKVWAKTKMCKFFPLGSCCQGTECQFAHDESELQPMPDLSCTKLCRTLVQTGKCTDPTCTYAHSGQQLVSSTPEVRRSRGQCRFWLRGSCVLGDRCTHAHEHVPASRSAAPPKPQRASTALHNNRQNQVVQPCPQSTMANIHQGSDAEAVTQGQAVFAVPFPVGVTIAQVPNLGSIGFAVDSGNGDSVQPQMWQNNGMMNGPFVQQGHHRQMATMWQLQPQCSQESVVVVPQTHMARTCSCGTTFHDDCKFCRMCGVKRAQLLEAKHCRCGAPFTADALFCGSCGDQRSRLGHAPAAKDRSESLAGSTDDPNESDGYDTQTDWE